MLISNQITTNFKEKLKYFN